jgi:hypothetical protein
MGIPGNLSIVPIFALLAGLLPLQGNQACASEAFKTIPAAGLEQAKIHAIYKDGDFDEVVALIGAFTREHKAYSKDDSVFIAKHLAVIYTANPTTREKGKNYMFRLLELLPSAKIVDMFVSEEIDRIFDKIREEFIVRERSLGRATPTKIESNQFAADKMSVEDGDVSPPSEKKKKKRSSHAGYWVAGGATLVAIAGGAAYVITQNRKSRDKIYDID